SSDEFTPFTYGLNLGVKTRIYKNINFYFSGNYHFQSVYNQNIDFITSLKSCKPLQIKMGLSIDLL
ncbi:MAG: hypothetical protein U9R32_09770, partial [Bacteroidota bacterium]|nr:hypothetical protein [Bacteroidota bacterium]